MAKSTTDAVGGASNQWLWSRVKPSVLTNVSPTAELLSSAIEWLRVNGPLKVCRFFPPSTACSPGPARDATAARSVGFRSTRAFRFLLARPAYRIRTAAVVRRGRFRQTDENTRRTRIVGMPPGRPNVYTTSAFLGPWIANDFVSNNA